MSGIYRVVLADDHSVVREGLKMLLSTIEDTSIVGEARDYDTLLLELNQCPCDLLVLDLGMPGFLGYTLIEEIRTAHPRLNIIILSANSDRQSIDKALEAGADLYLTKNGNPDELVAAVRSLRNAKLDGIPTTISHHAENRPAGNPLSDVELPMSVALTRREKQFLALIPRGSTTREIAERLGISVPTARKHRENLMRKLGKHNSAELTAYAVRLGLPVE